MNLAAAECLDAEFLRERDVHGSLVAGLRPFHLRAEVFGHAVGQGQLLLDFEANLGELVEFAFAEFDGHVGRHVVVEFDHGHVAVFRSELTVGFEDPLAFAGHFGFGVLVNRAAELETLVIRQVELGANLDVELVDERAFLGDGDRVRVQVRRAERRDRLLFRELLEARHEDLRLHFLGHRIVVALLDHLAGGLAGAEPANLRLIAERQFRELLVEALVDLGALNGDLDVLLARSGVLDLDLLVELLRSLRIGDGRGRSVEFRKFRHFRFRRDFVAHRAAPLNEEPGSWWGDWPATSRPARNFKLKEGFVGISRTS